MEKEYSSFERRRAYQLFNEAVTQEAIERMADDLYVFQRPSIELEKLESLAVVFMEVNHSWTTESYEFLRKQALDFRDKEAFLLHAKDHFSYGSPPIQKYLSILDKYAQSKPIFHVVK